MPDLIRISPSADFAHIGFLWASPPTAPLWERVNASGFLTANEKRAMVGFGPVEGGDVVV